MVPLILFGSVDGIGCGIGIGIWGGGSSGISCSSVVYETIFGLCAVRYLYSVILPPLAEKCLPTALSLPGTKRYCPLS